MLYLWERIKFFYALSGGSDVSAIIEGAMEFFFSFFYSTNCLKKGCGAISNGHMGLYLWGSDTCLE